MPRRNESSAVIDGVLRLVAMGGLTMTALLAPNAVQLLDKPLQKYFLALDERARDREMKRVAAYLRNKRLVASDYEHGLHITDKARKRLERLDIDRLAINTDIEWDGKWRIAFYDIPEDKRQARRALAYKLRSLGCYQLQRSVWVHPYPCYEVIAAMAQKHEVEQYLTYIEASHIENQSVLIKKFPSFNLSSSS